MLCLPQVISAYGHMSYILKVCQVRNSPALLTHSSKSFHKTNRPSSVPITLCLVIFVAYKCLECLSKVRHNVFTRSQPEFGNLRYKSEGAFLWDVNCHLEGRHSLSYSASLLKLYFPSHSVSSWPVVPLKLKLS